MRYVRRGTSCCIDLLLSGEGFHAALPENPEQAGKFIHKKYFIIQKVKLPLAKRDKMW